MDYFIPRVLRLGYAAVFLDTYTKNNVKLCVNDI